MSEPRVLRNRKHVVLALVVLLGLAGAGYANRWRVLEPTFVSVSGNPTRDFSDPRRLVGGATYVFLGEVTEVMGTVDHYESMVQTEVRVKVVEVLKGEPGREMIVSQWGGLSKLHNVVKTYEGDPLLRVGEVALFSIAVAGNNDGVTWQQTVFPGYGNVRVTGEESRSATVERFKRAVTEQITPEQEAAEFETQQ